MPISALFYFSVAVIKCSKKKLEAEKSHFDSQFKVTVHHCKGTTVAGTWGSWSHLICRKETKNNQWRCISALLSTHAVQKTLPKEWYLLTMKIDVPSINTIEIIPHKHIQWLNSQVNPRSMMLKVNSDCHTVQALLHPTMQLKASWMLFLASWSCQPWLLWFKQVSNL